MIREICKNPLLLSYSPRWRQLEAQTCGGSSADKWVERYQKFLQTKGVQETLDIPVQLAEQLFLDETFYRPIVETFILGNAGDKIVADYCGVDEEVIVLYKKIFYDIEGIPKTPGRLRVLAENPTLPNERTMKKLVVRYGLDFFMWYIGATSKIEDHSITNSVKNLLIILIFRSFALLESPIQSKAYEKYLKTIQLLLNMLETSKEYRVDSEMEHLFDKLKKMTKDVGEHKLDLEIDMLK